MEQSISLSTDGFKNNPKIITKANKSGARVNLEKPNEERDIHGTLWLSINLMPSLPCQKCFVAYMQIGYLLCIKTILLKLKKKYYNFAGRTP